MIFLDSEKQNPIENTGELLGKVLKHMRHTAAITSKLNAQQAPFQGIDAGWLGSEIAEQERHLLRAQRGSIPRTSPVSNEDFSYSPSTVQAWIAGNSAMTLPQMQAVEAIITRFNQAFRSGEHGIAKRVWEPHAMHRAIEEMGADKAASARPAPAPRPTPAPRPKPTPAAAATRSRPLRSDHSDSASANYCRLVQDAVYRMGGWDAFADALFASGYKKTSTGERLGTATLKVYFAPSAPLNQRLFDHVLKVVDGYNATHADAPIDREAIRLAFPSDKKAVGFADQILQERDTGSDGQKR